MKCGNCQKEFEGQTYKTGNLIDVCYECFQKEHYKQDANYQKWQNIKQNLTAFFLWVSNGDKKILQEETDIQKYFYDRFYNTENKYKTYEINNRKFFVIDNHIQLEAFQTTTRKRLLRTDGEPGDVFGLDGNNFYLIKKVEFEELTKSLKQ